MDHFPASHVWSPNMTPPRHEQMPHYLDRQTAQILVSAYLRLMPWPTDSQHGFAVQLPALPVVGQTSWFIKYHKISVTTGFSGILNGMISIFFVHPRLLRTHSVAIISDQTSGQRFMAGYCNPPWQKLPFWSDYNVHKKGHHRQTWWL